MTSSTDAGYLQNTTYNPPEWASKLAFLPTHRVSLGHLNTPIHRWHLPDIPPQFQVSIKRDDMTGSTLSGNKVRKLEFLLGDALNQGCKHIITSGAIQSNHVRATMVASTQLGLKTHALLRTKDGTEDVGCEGNVLFDRMCGAKIYMTPWDVTYKRDLKPRAENLQQDILNKTGEKAYIIPYGGSDKVGTFGYVEAFNELIKQDVMSQFDDLVFTTSSGGTAEGLAIANYLTGSRVKLHGVCVSKYPDELYEFIGDTLLALGLNDVKAQDLVDFIHEYMGKGYAISTPEELEFITSVSKSTGIMLDPVYTGKGVLGMVEELNKNPHRFRGNRVLYIHTGGMFGMFTAGKLYDSVPAAERCHLYKWPDMNVVPDVDYTN